MKRKRIILGVLAAALLVTVAGIAAWHLAFRHGLTEPIALVEIPAGEFLMGTPEDEEREAIYPTPGGKQVTE